MKRSAYGGKPFEEMAVIKDRLLKDAESMNVVCVSSWIGAYPSDDNEIEIIHKSVPVLHDRRHIICELLIEPGTNVDDLLTALEKMVEDVKPFCHVGGDQS